MAFLPTPPAPRTVTLTGGRSGESSGRPAPLEGVERRGHAVPGHVAQVLDEAPPVVAGDHVERDRLDAEAAQQLDALRPRREVEHRDQDRAGPEQLVPALGRPQHDDDVLRVRRRLVDDVHARRRGTVIVVGVAHAEPAPGLDVDVGVHAGEQAASGGRKARRSPGSLYMRGKPKLRWRSLVLPFMARASHRGDRGARPVGEQPPAPGPSRSRPSCAVDLAGEAVEELAAPRQRLLGRRPPGRPEEVALDEPGEPAPQLLPVGLALLELGEPEPLLARLAPDLVLEPLDALHDLVVLGVAGGVEARHELGLPGRARRGRLEQRRLAAAGPDPRPDLVEAGPQVGPVRQDGHRLLEVDRAELAQLPPDVRPAPGRLRLDPVDQDDPARAPRTARPSVDIAPSSSHVAAPEAPRAEREPADREDEAGDDPAEVPRAEHRLARRGWRAPGPGASRAGSSIGPRTSTRKVPITRAATVHPAKRRPERGRRRRSRPRPAPPRRARGRASRRAGCRPRRPPPSRRPRAPPPRRR